MKHSYCDGIRRRDMLQAGALGLLGWTLADFLRLVHAGTTPKPTADSVLFLNLAGGPSHLDTLDMKPDGPAETRGEFQPIQSKIAGLAVCEHLPKLAEHMDRFTLIRGISHTAGAHGQAQSYIATGNPANPAVVYPSYGSVVSKELTSPSDLPPYAAIPSTEWNAGYMGDAFAPFQTNAVPERGKAFSVRGITLPEGITLDKVQRRQRLLGEIDTRFRQADTDSKLLDALDTFSSQAYRMITSTRTREAFDVSQEPQSIQELFAADELGQSLFLAVRLIEFGVRFVTVTNTGWDTHLDNFNGHRRLMPPLDSGLTAAVSALEAKGLLRRTLVVAMGEFGRTPKINPNAGRDHHPRVNWCLMAGGGVRPGQLIGGTEQGGEAPNDDTNIKPDDIGASVLHALGIDHHKEYHTQTGRPVSLIPQGNVIPTLFG